MAMNLQIYTFIFIYVYIVPYYIIYRPMTMFASKLTPYRHVHVVCFGNFVLSGVVIVIVNNITDKPSKCYHNLVAYYIPDIKVLSYVIM